MASAAPADLDRFNVQWDSPSIDSAGSMPIGNGEVVLNVWVEKSTSDILLLIARTDALSEISRVLKLGLVRVHFDRPLFLGTDFQQNLNLREGRIEFTGGGETLQLVVDSGSNVIHLFGRLMQPRMVSARFETWRTTDRELPKSENRSAWSVHDAPFPLVETADVILDNTGHNDVTWYHHNSTSVVPQLWANQSLTGLPGCFDPLINRTFGGSMIAAGMSPKDRQTLRSVSPLTTLDLTIATHKNFDAAKFPDEVRALAKRANTATAQRRTRAWWHDFWDRSWVFAEETQPESKIPDNNFPLRKGVDSNGQNQFPGEIQSWHIYDRALNYSEIKAGNLPESPFESGKEFHPVQGLTIIATIKPTANTAGRIADKLTAGQSDGFLFDTHPGRSLRLIVGDSEYSVPNCLKIGEWQTVAATYDSKTGISKIYLNNELVGQSFQDSTSVITRGYVLQRYVQACQGRGEYPIKFNGGYYCVDPKPMGITANHDYRNWGDSHWFQNVRHMYHPMLQSGDFELMEPFFRLYENNRELAESRTKLYHGCQGAYFPETMTVFGTYSGGDYGWDRTGLQPKDVQCPWWDDAWNQGPELVALMLDRYDYTNDRRFLRERVLPMANSVLQYFDTRFKKDAAGRIILDPTQVVETFWEGVVNDMPSTAGLIAITNRLCELPKSDVSPNQMAFFERMRKSCPELPLRQVDGYTELAPAQKFAPKVTNVENGELYAVWPFQIASIAKTEYLDPARRAYMHRQNNLDLGWGYDGNVAALLGLTDEAARILNKRVRNSHPAYRWPATWGPNFDWLPDQNHGGNLLNTCQLMLLQSEPLEQGGAIRLLPAWPHDWKVKFKLHAPGNTTVQGEYVNGVISNFVVKPESRRKDIILPNRITVKG